MEFNLTQEQIKILNGKLCPYCKSVPEYIDSSFVYGKSYGMIYICKKCDAYCGVHKGTDKPLGRLADRRLRHWKKEAHAAFDIIWQEGYQKRKKAYSFLSEYLGIPRKYTHIGMFNVDTCIKFVEWASEIYSDIKRFENDIQGNPELVEELKTSVFYNYKK